MNSLFFMSFLAIGTACADEPWGERSAAKSAHAEAFKPGNVVVDTIDGVESYVICAVAERHFEDDKDAELYREALLDTKSLLREHLLQDDATRELELVNYKSIYQWQSGSNFYVVAAVAKKNVTIRKKPQPKPAETKKEKPKETEKTAAKETAPAPSASSSRKATPPVTTGAQVGSAASASTVAAEEESGISAKEIAEKRALAATSFEKGAFGNALEAYEFLVAADQSLDASSKDQLVISKAMVSSGQKGWRALIDAGERAHKQNDSTRALLFYRHARDLEPDPNQEEDWLFSAGKIAEESNNKADARWYYERLLEKYPRSMRRPDVKFSLAKLK